VITQDDYGNDRYYRIENNIVYGFSELFYLAGDHEEDSGVADDEQDDTEDENPFRDELPLLRFDAQPGASYDIMSFSQTVFGGAFFSMTWTGASLGTDDVTVIAGTFGNCKVFEIVYDSVAVGGGSSSYQRITTTLWLAEGVGKVRSVETKSDGEAVTRTREEELIGFSIP